MDERIVNVLIASIPGDGLPDTYSLPVSFSASVQEIWNGLYDRLPPIQTRLLLSTLGNRYLYQNESSTVGELLSSPEDDFISLRVSIPTLGGKGGFGSQLRAAGGRMSSKRRKNQAEDNGSSRNLDGRRLRTVAEAKSLAEYLAIKPDMDRKEKEKRRQRWEDIVESAEKKEDEIKHGGKGRLDGKWVEDKEEASERTRLAVLSAMQTGQFVDNLQLSTSAGSATSAASDSRSSSGKSEGDNIRITGETTDDDSSSTNGSGSPVPELRAARALSKNPTTSDKGKGKAKVFFAFDDEDDEFLSSDEDEGPE